MHVMQGAMPLSRWIGETQLQQAACLILLLLSGGALYGLWGGEEHLMEKISILQADVSRQQQENAALQQRNHSLAAEVLDLREGVDAIEERARNELGMIRDGETFYRVILPPTLPLSLDEDIPHPLPEVLQ